MNLRPDIEPRSAPEALHIYWFPHAGSRVASYAPWRALMPGHVRHTLVEYPGHGARGDALADTMDDVVRAVRPQLATAERTPFVFVGHSMGALVAFATAVELARERRRLPGWLGLSGRNGPEVGALHPARRSDAELVAMLRAFGGTPDELLTDPVQRARFLATLRADFEVCDRFRPPPMRLPIPLTAYYGGDDPSTRPEAILTWSWWTTGAFTMRRFSGGHFFPFAQRRLFAEALLRDVDSIDAEKSHERIS